MNSELLNLQHPLRLRILWGLLYLLLVSAFIFGMYRVADRIKTHTLPSGQIQLTVPYSKYLVGETITFTIKNGYNSPIYIMNNCPSEPLEVYRLENERWVRQHDQASIADCRSEKRQVDVAANGVVSGSFAPWHNLFSQPGKYRVVAFVEYYNELPYQEFEVLAQPSQKTSVSGGSTPSIEQETAQQPQTNQYLTPYTVKQEKTVSTNAGSITVQYDSTNIYVISVAPASGCTYEGGRSGRQVEVTFKCKGSQTQVQLSIVNGKLFTKIEPGDE